MPTHRSRSYSPRRHVARRRRDGHGRYLRRSSTRSSSSRSMPRRQLHSSRRQRSVSRSSSRIQRRPRYGGRQARETSSRRSLIPLYGTSGRMVVGYVKKCRSGVALCEKSIKKSTKIKKANQRKQNEAGTKTSSKKLLKMNITKTIVKHPNPTQLLGRVSRHLKRGNEVVRQAKNTVLSKYSRDTVDIISEETQDMTTTESWQAVLPRKDKVRTPTKKANETGGEVNELTSTIKEKEMETCVEEVQKKVDEEAQKKAEAAEQEAAFNAELGTLMHEPWYYGLYPRDEIKELIQNEGDFLVRKTEYNGKNRFVISVSHNGNLSHILIRYRKKLWKVGDIRRPSVVELINFCVSTSQSVQFDGCVLRNVIKRPPYYILHEHVKLGKRLGEGAFGEVRLGTWTRSDMCKIEVAVKLLKRKTISKDDRKNFFRESSIMRKFNHPNIVTVFGFVAEDEPLMILMEYEPKGALNIYLKNHLEIHPEQLTCYVVDAARGMAYLADNKVEQLLNNPGPIISSLHNNILFLYNVIHRDVAARNCLLGQNDQAKISDFGLSVICTTDNIKVDRLRRVPVKWLSPETLKHGIFSTKSDVWSFGVFIWEVFNYCQTDPFPELSKMEARDKIKSDEIPMLPPKDTPGHVSDAMLLCFTRDPEKRPDFATLVTILVPEERSIQTISDFTPQLVSQYFS